MVILLNCRYPWGASVRRPPSDYSRGGTVSSLRLVCAPRRADRKRGASHERKKEQTMKPVHALAITSVLALGLVPLGPAVEGNRGEGAGSAATPSPRVMPSAQAGKGTSGYLDCE